MNAIELHQVTAGYNGVAAVGELDLEVRAGEVVVLLGANGAGKSTTIRTVCGLAEVHRGRVAVLGADVTNAPTRARARQGLATVTDDRGLFTQLTVAENLLIGARRGRPSAPLDDWFPDLRPLVHRRAGLLSGGEQTLLALARALVSRPRALLVDEPTRGLAPGLAGVALSVLRRAAAEWGTGVLVAEQSAELALGAADRACLLRRGRIVEGGDPVAMARRPGVLESTYLGDLE